MRRGIDHAEILASLEGDACWTGRHLFMVVIAADIAMLGLLLSFPAVVIGAMLLPRSWGLSSDWALASPYGIWLRSDALVALGVAVAVGFATLLVMFSPLQTMTDEIATRTRPNLSDLVMAMAVPLKLALRQIGCESLAQRRVCETDALAFTLAGRGVQVDRQPGRAPGAWYRNSTISCRQPML